VYRQRRSFITEQKPSKDKKKVKRQKSSEAKR
ncbi:unnamed protein product, partial [marine sediment metagenome]